MALTETDISKPWYISEGESTYISNGFSRGVRFTCEVTANIKTVKDSTRCRQRLGSIVKFYNGFRAPYMPDWKEWFLTKKDKMLNAIRVESIPLYASLQYGIIVNKYKKIKRKPHGTFTDYGTAVLLLTGPKIGKVKFSFMSSPFSKVCDFENIYKIKRLKKPFKCIDNTLFLDDININQLHLRTIKEFGIGEDSRIEFINILYNNLERLKYVNS